MTHRRYIFGEWHEANGALTVDDARSICARAHQVRAQSSQIPFDKIQQVLARMSAFWSDPDEQRRVSAIDQLHSETGYSKEMITLGMDNLARILDPAVLQAKVDTELRGIPIQRGFSFDAATNTAFQWQPIGTVLHVLAGNVFSGGPGSWIEGVLTRNVNILKMSSSERTFLPMFIESLQDCDPEGVLAPMTCVIDYSSKQRDVMEVFKEQVDGIVVWGGEEAVRGYRNDLPARTKLVVFGPKLSLATITDAGLQSIGVDSAAEKLAAELAIWDQNACTAPQVCYVQGKQNAEDLTKALDIALSECEKTLPAGRTDLHTAVEIRKLRGVFEIAESNGRGLSRGSKSGIGWSVFCDQDQTLEPSPLHRTIRIIPYSDLDEVLEQIDSYRGYVQTVALTCSTQERWRLTQTFYERGAIRIVGLGQMAGGEINDPHDGAFDLPQLLNLTLHRSAELNKGIDPLEAMDAPARLDLLNEKFRRLLFHAEQSSYYRERLETFEEKQGRRLESLVDLPSFPILTRDLMEENMPPRGDGLATTREYSGGYVTRSGGSTGEPKFSIYDGRDWEAAMENGVRLFRALGLKRGDRLANCMIAGDLYGSFVSFDHINVRLGVTTFGFANRVDADGFLKAWRKFRINAIQGVPAFVMPLLREVKRLAPEFTLDTFIFAGQPLSDSDRSWLKSELRVDRIGSVIGANDGCQIAYQCSEMSGATHHVIDDYNYIEIVDEEGNPVKEGEPGKILITSLEKYQFPLIRYDIGDRARFLSGDCSCGRTTRRIEFLGRGDDRLNVGLMNLEYADVVDAVAGFEVSALQVAAKLVDNKDAIEIRVESENADPAFSSALRTAILHRLPVLQARLDSQNFSYVEVIAFAPGKLPRNARSAKIKAVVDER